MNRVFPFLWVNDDTSADSIEQEIIAMKGMNLNSFVVESRVFSDFCGEKWFRIMEHILNVAKKNGMTVWLLDDKSYPTGIANGALYKSFPEHNARHIIVNKVDVAGTADNVKIRLNFSPLKGDELISVFLAERKTIDCYRHIINVTDKVFNDMLYVDIPAGNYSVLYIVETFAYAERGYYIDMLNKDSVKVLIDTVYESHYKHFKSYFGNTFAGFFSDEPRFANGRYANVYVGNDYETFVGKFGVAYPWKGSLKDELNFSEKDLLALWFDIGESTSDIRIKYMDKITDLYASNFSGQIAAWCHERGVVYTGHIIEDMDAHTKTGCSAGHYFKSVKGMDYASVDVVLHQIKRFENDCPHYAPICGGYADPLFFNNTLAKLASSDSRLDDFKKGNACCEVFGAYGWCESSAEMLFLVNHMLVRGINMFIPHAFISVFGFSDCPPHFYAGNKNNAGKAHALIFKYMEDMANLLSNNKADFDYAVLYHAEAEWSGKKFVSIDRVNKELFDLQKDFDIVDFSALENAEITETGFKIFNRKYKYLVVPYFEYLPQKYLKILDRFSQFIIKYDGKFSGLSADNKVEGLKVFRHFDGKRKIEFIVNENNKKVYYKNSDKYKYAVDYLRNTYENIKNQICVDIGQSYILTNEINNELCVDNLCGGTKADKFDVYIKSIDDDEFSLYKKDADCSFDINAPSNKPEFSGHIKYKFSADLTDIVILRVEFCGDCCEVVINGKSFVGADKFLFIELFEELRKSVSVEIILSNSLAYSVKDDFSLYDYISPCTLKNVYLYKNKTI